MRLLAHIVLARYLGAAKTPVMWKYEDPEGNTFFLLEKKTTVHSPFTGKTFPAHPKKHNPRQAPAAEDVGDRIRDAYQKVSGKTGRVRILISDLQKESKVPMAQLHDWLDKECTAHRANPSRGEFTAATKEQQDGALMIDGEPHLYIELLGQ
jgi:hypothetical protein